MTGCDDGFNMDFGGTELLRMTLACLSGLTSYWAMKHTRKVVGGKER